MVENFVGQWLLLRNIPAVTPDPNIFPTFDENLRDAFRRESELFVEHVMREDGSLVDLLDADYTFVNERLAEHYGIPGVYGNRFRRVTLDRRRGGLLGHGGLLTVTSYPNRTSPVLRGKWVLENLLGVPPPPPPPDVPSFPERGPGGEPASVRELLEMHRGEPRLRGLPRPMDPLGFALETRRHRPVATTDGHEAIDARGAMPTGDAFEGLDGLRALLVNDPSRWCAPSPRSCSPMRWPRHRALRLPDYSQDRPDAAGDGHRWSAVVLGIVQSPPFQLRCTGS